VNERQIYALTHPASDPHEALNPQLKRVRRHGKGWHIMTILAVDR